MLSNNMENNQGKSGAPLTPHEKLMKDLEKEKEDFSREIDGAFDRLIDLAPKEIGAKLVGTETHDDFSNLTEEIDKREVNHREKYIIFTYVTPEGKYIRKRYSFSGKERKWSVEE